MLRLPMLNGLRVLDLTDGRAHLTGKILGDLGADVVKVEPPGGDAVRREGPWVGGIPDPERSFAWLASNTSKRGIVLDLALEYAGQRNQFGQPISKFQAIQFKLADIATELEAARWLTYRAASLRDAGEPFLKEAAMAKLKASRLAVWAASEAVQIHGGLGYMLESPVARFYCDAKVLEIGEGTNEIQHLVIARALGC